MDQQAIRTIRIHNFKKSMEEAIQMAEGFLALIESKYPLGIENPDVTYFVMPGYEHVTKYQPIAIFTGIEGKWQLSNTTLFVEPYIIK